MAPRIPDLGTRWRWVVSFTPRPLCLQGKSRWYPLDRKLGGPRSRSGRGGEEKNSQPLPRLEPPIIQPVAQRYTTELYRLLSNRGEGKLYKRKHPRCYRDSNLRTCVSAVWNYMRTGIGPITIYRLQKTFPYFA
jgi:hypothetical protein